MHICLNIRMNKSILHEKAENEKKKTFYYASSFLDSSYIPVLTCYGFRIQKKQNP